MADAPSPDWHAQVRRRLSRRAGVAVREDPRLRDAVEEIAQHLEDAYREAIAAGLSPEQAEARVLEHHADWRALARAVAAPEPPPPPRRSPMIDSLAQDLRFAARSLVSRPLFTLTVLFLLAFGIGANTALFAIVDAVLLSPLPYAEPNRLLAVAEADRRAGGELEPSSLKAANLLELQGASATLDEVAGYWHGPVVLIGDDGPEMVAAIRTSPNLFALLGVDAAIGSTFAEQPRDAAFTVVLDHGYWQQRFGGDPAVVGSRLTLNDESYTVVGVLPQGFAFVDPASAFIVGAHPVPEPPFDVGPDYQTDRSIGYMRGLARLAPGASLPEAIAELEAIATTLEREFPEDQRARTFTAVPLRDNMVGSVRGALLLALGAVGCVLLIACANVANLLLTRASGRRNEIAVRTALGASRSRVLRQLLTESVVLAAAGGLLGVATAMLVMGPLRALLPASVPRTADIAIDGGVLAFALLVSLFTGIAFGMAPALHSAFADIHSVLRETSRGSSGGRSRLRLGDALVVAEVALAAVLLIGAGLALRTLTALQSRDPGFDPEQVLTFRISLPPAKYDSEAAIRSMYWRLYDEINGLPGVESAATVFGIPFSSMRANMTYTVVGQPDETEEFTAIFQAVSPDYFATVGIPRLTGRDFTRADNADAPMVAIVNEELARRHFPGGDPLAESLDLGDGTTLRIVGVVGSTRYGGYASEVEPEIYLAFEQFTLSFTSMVVRAERDAEQLVGPIRSKVLQIDPDQPVHRVQLLSDLMHGTVAQPRFNSRLLSLFAAVALGLAVVGVFGVVSYAVAQRTHEFGIRVALGAEARRLRRMVLMRGALLAGAGILTGVAGAAVLARLAQSLWFGVSANDPVVFAVVPAVLAAAALLASWAPARRATRVDPVVALRSE